MSRGGAEEVGSSIKAGKSEEDEEEDKEDEEEEEEEEEEGVSWVTGSGMVRVEVESMRSEVELPLLLRRLVLLLLFLIGRRTFRVFFLAGGLTAAGLEC